MSSGGEQQPTEDGLHAQVAAQLSDVLEPSRTEHFPLRSYTIADVVGDTEASDGAVSAAVLGVAATPDAAEWVDIAEQITDKHPVPHAAQSWPHLPPLRRLQGGTDTQLITPEWDAWMRAEGLQRPPLYQRMQDASPNADKPTLILPAFGAGPSIAHTVQAAQDSRQGAADALARGWSKLISVRRAQTAPDTLDAAPGPAVVKTIEQTAETTTAQPSSDTQPENKGWGTDQSWWLEAVVATQGTRARFFQQIQAAQPQLTRDEAWRRATKQAYDDLKERCPDGSIVPSSHPWDREYMRQIKLVNDEREAALAALESIRESSDTAAYEAAIKATQQQYNGLDMFNRAVAATNNILSTELNQYDTIMHQFRLDGEENITSSVDLVWQVCEADLIEDNAFRTILNIAAARGIEPSDVVNAPELEGDRGSDRREVAAARLIAHGFARQVINARAAAAKEEMPVPQSTYELARPITPAVNDRPVQPALIRHLGRAWSDMIAQRNQRQVTFVYQRPGSLRNPWLHAGDAAEPEAVTAAYYSPAVSEPVHHAPEEGIFVQDEQDILPAAEAGTAPRARINIPARMLAFRKHVAAVRELRHRTDTSDLPSASTARAIADAKRQYATDSIDVQAALTTRWANLSAERSAWVKAAYQAHAAGDEAVQQVSLANADRITAQLEYEGLNSRGIDAQAASAAYFRASTRFTPDVLAAAGITLAAGDIS